SDVTERGGDLPSEIELRRLRHRGADVEDQVDRQVLLFFEQAQEQAADALVRLPVDVPEVVAVGILAVIGEFDAAPALGRAPVGAITPGELAPRDDPDVFEL